MKDSGEIINVNNKNKILWSCVARNDTVLAEAALDYSDGVFQTATELLAKKPTPGFEYHTQNRWKKKRAATSSSKGRQPLLKGIKFHVYEVMDDCDDSDDGMKNKNSKAITTTNNSNDNLRIWIFAAVYDPSTMSNNSSASSARHDVQSFLEKMVTISENVRHEWRNTEQLGLQGTFAPILQQRMQEVTYYGKMALLDQQVQACHDTMRDNIEVILNNQARIDDLDREATHLQEMASVFQRNSRKLRRAQMMKNAKHGLILGTVVTAATAAIVIPPLVAIF